MKTIDDLKEMVNRLPHLSDLIQNEGYKKNYVEYAVEGGTCFGIGLLSQEDVSIQKVFISKGTLFPKHKHKSIEILIVFSGSIEITYKNEKKILDTSDVIRFDKNGDHHVTALEDAWIIATSIPREEGYAK